MSNADANEEYFRDERRRLVEAIVAAVEAIPDFDPTEQEIVATIRMAAEKFKEAVYAS